MGIQGFFFKRLMKLSCPVKERLFTFSPLSITDTDYCQPNPCSNGGYCTSNDQTNGFVCHCAEGWRGLTCTGIHNYFLFFNITIRIFFVSVL